MYPIFIALCHCLALPLKLGEHLVYVTFCLVLIRAVRPLGLRPWWLLAIYTAVLFDPVWLFDDLHRIGREHVYAGFTGFVFACAVGMLLRRHLPLRWTCLWGVGLGLGLACLWLTREEGVWVVPSLLLLLLWGGWTVLRHHPQPVRWFLACCIPIGICFLGDAMVRWANWRHYGIYAVCEFTIPEFEAAYGALARITPANFQRRVPVPKEVRRRAYRVSPAFRELEPFLDGPVGEEFVRYSAAPGSGQDFQGEIGGGHFLWALRDAAGYAGHCKTGTEAIEYYARIAREINDACDRGLLAAGPRRDSLVGRFDASFLPLIADSLAKACQTLVFRGDQELTASVGPSVGDEEAFVPFREMSHASLSPTDPPLVQATGWGFAPAATLDLRVLTAGGDLVTSTLTWHDSPGLYWEVRAKGRDIRNASHARFTLDFPKIQNGILAVLADGKLAVTIPLDGQPRRVDSPNLVLEIEKMRPRGGEFAAGTDAENIDPAVDRRLLQEGGAAPGLPCTCRVPAALFSLLRLSS